MDKETKSSFNVLKKLLTEKLKGNTLKKAIQYIEKNKSNFKE